MERENFVKKSLRDKITIGSIVSFLLCGLVGLHYNDWTTYAILIPFGWGIAGCLLDFLVNGKQGTGNSITIGVFLALILTNMATILVHRDTVFIVGRLLCSLGAAILILRTSYESQCSK